MPCKVDKIKLAEHLDRRRKLTQEQKQDIYNLYHKVGLYSLNDLAKIYNVSKKTILLIVNKNSKLKNDINIKNNYKKYYDKAKHNLAIKNTRKYKKELMEKGEI